MMGVSLSKCHHHMSLSVTFLHVTCLRGLPFSMYTPRGGCMGSSLLYISIAYYMQKGGGWVMIACQNAYVLNGRPLIFFVFCFFCFKFLFLTFART